MRIIDAFVVATLAAGVPPAAAQGGVQTQRLMATSIPLDATPTSSALAAIWRDRLAAERTKLAMLATHSPGSSRTSSNVSVNAFSASFKDGDRTIILSALFTTPECANFSGAAAPSLNNCPMRVAALQHGQVKVVASASDFPFVAALKDVANDKGNEFDNQTQRDKTLVMFDPATHEITTALTMNGVLDAEKATPIRIAY
jgi:hypothetical protein